MAETRSSPGSPLPQKGPAPAIQAVRLSQGFFSQLPPNALAFYDRHYISDFPRPIQVGPGNAYPRQVPILDLTVPAGEVIVVRNGVFNAYQQNGLGIEDTVPVDHRRLLTFVAFSFDVNGRAQADIQNNIYGVGGLLGKQAVALGQGALSAGAQVPSTALPYGGSMAVGPVDSFALYAMPQQRIRATAWVVRPPPFEIRRFSFDMSGWTLSKVGFEKIKTGFSY